MQEGGHIGSGTALMMACLALFIDGLQAFLDFILIGILVNPMIDLVAALIFYIWFSHHGIRLGSSKRLLGYLGTIFAEMLPIFNVLPAWTLFVVYTCLKSRASEAMQGTQAE